MIKLEIWPAFINRSSFELKQSDGGWEMFIIKNSYEFTNDPGGIWISDKIESVIAKNIVELSYDLIKDKSESSRFGIDGVSTKLKLEKDGVEFEKEFWCPEQNTKEYRIITLFFGQAEKYFDSIICQDYLELLGQYYFNTSPIKAYEEDPFRLKVFGGLSISELKVLIEKIDQLIGRPQGILDMTNFLTTGSVLNACFLQIREADHIRIKVNENAHNYLTEIGFPSERLERTPNKR